MSAVILAELPNTLVPLGLGFMLFVAPVWLWLHYRRGGGTQAELQRLEAAISALSNNAQRLEQRVISLETALLDAEHAYRSRV
jgi:phage shock protein B